jgi:hypothetical protein
LEDETDDTGSRGSNGEKMTKYEEHETRIDPQVEFYNEQWDQVEEGWREETSARHREINAHIDVQCRKCGKTTWLMFTRNGICKECREK